MQNEQGSNGNGSGGDDLAADLDDWLFAGRGIVRVVERLGRSLPAFGPHQRAEVGQLIASADAEFARLVSAWQTILRPGLARYEGSDPPGWVTAGTGDPEHVPQPPPPLDVEAYSDGHWVAYWAGGAGRLLTLAEGLRECFPVTDAGVAHSIATFHIPRLDEQFAWVLNGYQTAVRPRLQKYRRRVTRW